VPAAIGRQDYVLPLRHGGRVAGGAVVGRPHNGNLPDASAVTSRGRTRKDTGRHGVSAETATSAHFRATSDGYGSAGFQPGERLAGRKKLAQIRAGTLGVAVVAARPAHCTGAIRQAPRCARDASRTAHRQFTS
jgi:hypothetical protein